MAVYLILTLDHNIIFDENMFFMLNLCKVMLSKGYKCFAGVIITPPQWPIRKTNTFFVGQCPEIKLKICKWSTLKVK